MAWSDTETNIMRDIFLLMRNNADANNTVEYWCRLTDQVDAILHKYNGHELAVDMCIAACQYYEKQIDAIRES